LYFSRKASACPRRITPLWATATIRARPIGSNISNAVGTQYEHFTLAYGHVASPADKPSACRKASYPEKYDNLFVTKLTASSSGLHLFQRISYTDSDTIFPNTLVVFAIAKR
jgi:hypothetical protein